MWTDSSVFYQIYPLGFCDTPKENDGITVSRILKVIEWIPYYKDLGIDTILFNPLFDSDRHGYDTRDMRQVDCRLGTNDDFIEVCKALKANGIRVVLDAVFNHVGRGFWAFQDVLEKKWDSPYKDWFNLNFDQNSGYNDGFWYEGWEGHYELVKLNLHHEAVIEYILDSVKLWIEAFGISGLRLDVAYCLDRGFMERLRSYCNGLNQEFVLIGEVLFGDYNQIVNPAMLHSCTNYEVYKGLHSSLNSDNLFEISYSLNRQFGPEHWTIYKGLQLLSFVDNHDVTRIASILKDEKLLPVVYGLLFGMPGIPCIYYGSEWGEKGHKDQGDDSLRPSYTQPEKNELYYFIKQLIEAYKQSPALQSGTYTNLVVQNKHFAFQRSFNGQNIVVACNIDHNPAELYHPNLTGTGRDLLTKELITMEQKLTLNPFQLKIIQI